MNRILPVIVLFLIIALTGTAKQSAYHLNQTKIDYVFDQSIDLGSSLMDLSTNTSADETEGMNNTTAAIIAFGTVVVPYFIYGGWWIFTAITGGIGIIFLPIAIVFAGAASLPWHRYFLGTNNETAKIMALYCVTFNWFGWLPIADGVFLLLDEEDSYKNNPNYIMWIDQI